MKKLAAFVLTLLPATVLAHPGHGETAYPLAHYFTGDHLVYGIIGAVVIVGAYFLSRRFSR